MTTVFNNSITLLESGQSFKEQLINETTRVLLLFFNPIQDKDLTTPPSNPNPDDYYIVAASATDEWTGQENKIAYPTLSNNNSVVVDSWEFFTPFEGTKVYVLDEGFEYLYTSGAWELIAPGSVPALGKTGEALVKNSDTTGDYDWQPVGRASWKSIYFYG